MSHASALEAWNGIPHLLRHEALLRWVLVGLALLWALAAARGRVRLALACGTLFALLAAGFWCLALARPYGVPYDSAVTREAASAALASAWGAPVGIVPGAPFAGGAWARLALLGVPDSWLLTLPNLLPIVVLPAPALLIHGLWRARAAPLAAVLWLTCATGDLVTLRGAGFLPGLWARPAASLGLLLAVAAGLVAGRSRSAWTRWPLIALAVFGAGLALSGPGAPLAVVPALLLAVVDHLFLWLLALPSRRRWDAATRALILLGLAALAAGACGLPCDPWGAATLLRLGLLLGGARTLDAWLPALGRTLRRGFGERGAVGRWVATSRPRALATGLIVLLLAPSSAHAWWRPQRLDQAYPGGLTPLSPDLLSAARWARVHTPREAVFVAVGESAAAVASLAARRVLDAPGIVEAPDEARRARLNYLAVADDDGQGRRNLRRYGVTHLFVARQDLPAWNLADWEALAASGRWRLLFVSGDYRLYEWTDGDAAPSS